MFSHFSIELISGKIMKILNISEATLIALHSLVFIAKSKDVPLSVKQISSGIGSSVNHVSKILQRMATQGFINSIRGPKGGFILISDPKKLLLIEIYESIQGKIEDTFCPFNEKACTFNKCLFQGLDKKISQEFIDYLNNTSLADLTE